MHHLRHLALLAGLALASAAACATEPLGSQSVVIGSATLECIEPGMGRRQVIALLGPPRERESGTGDIEVWRWSYREQASPTGATTFVIDNRLDPDESRAVFVEFQDKRVLRVWRL
ncbi:MAG: outer membrane protein assembly factor BamE [Planctomycetes bacterium]|nr:outer membrane protein assembly factor BamE [Planctomycetota bacterium]